MAPIKFEEHIKEKLDKREIKPSDASWSTIADRLKNEGNPKRKGYFWYGIAASFIGLLFISVLYFNRKEQQDPKATEMVTTPVSEKQSEESFVKKDIPVLVEKSEEAIVYTEKKSTIVQAQVETNRTKESTIHTSNRNLEESNPDLNTIAFSEKEKKEGIKTFAEAAIDAKIAEVIAQVDEREGTSAEMTNLEVDSLLRKAQRELLTNTLFRADNTVDAKALLAEAEGELDRSLRDQLFDTLKAGYLKVRTAVADRNN